MNQMLFIAHVVLYRDVKVTADDFEGAHAAGNRIRPGDWEMPVGAELVREGNHVSVQLRDHSNGDGCGRLWTPRPEFPPYFAEAVAT